MRFALCLNEELMNPIIQIRNLKKNYGRKEAVKGIDLEICPGELFVLLGPNGAGKTSTLKMLVGLLKPSSGNILIGGHDLSTDPLRAKKLLSFVPDVPYVYDKLTPWELLRFVGKLYNLNPESIHTRGCELLGFFELEEVQDVLIEEFSHGMKQKVVLSASLLHEPKVFILDEPMVGLDPVSIRDFKNFLKKKTREGMTVVFSTHTLPLAEELADRIAVMAGGKVIALGTLVELKSQFSSEGNLEQMFMKLVDKTLLP